MWRRADPIVALTRIRSALLAVAMSLATGCSCGPPSNPDAGGCPNDLPTPAACDGGVPSYQGQVKNLFGALCVVCHSQGTAVGAAWPMYDYNWVSSNQSSVLDDIYACRMPPPDAGPGQPALVVSETQRQLMLAWLVCGAPSN